MSGSNTNAKVKTTRQRQKKSVGTTTEGDRGRKGYRKRDRERRRKRSRETRTRDGFNDQEQMSMTCAADEYCSGDAPSVLRVRAPLVPISDDETSRDKGEEKQRLDRTFADGWVVSTKAGATCCQAKRACGHAKWGRSGDRATNVRHR